PASSPADGVSCRGLPRTDRAGSHRGVSSPVGSPQRGDRVGLGPQPGLVGLPWGGIVWEVGINPAPWCRLFIPRRLGEVDPWLGSMALVSDHVYGLLAWVQSDRVCALLCTKPHRLGVHFALPLSLRHH